MQPEIYFRYLSGKNPGQPELELYHAAISHHTIQFTPKENRLHKCSQRYPFLIPFIDGGLALIQPLSPYRKNIYIILCILETQPQYFPLLSSSMNEKKKQNFFSFFFHGIRAAFTGLCGVIIVKVI
ncbi:MAG: hypothetical protein POELPBGB_02286 [Bacteroidia bacterium]|nr:hypothetical protein [Bacteroidia bacterium]